jgi:sugar phosphate isomerase/epimerase
MMNSIPRRRFLQNAGLGLTAFALSRQGQLLADPYGMPIGLQLYTVRDHMEKDLEGTLKRVAEIGYKVVELGSFDYYGKKPAELWRILTDHGLKVTSTHFTESQLKSDLEKHIAAAKECGIPYLGLASLDEQDRKSLEAVKRDGEWFNQIGKSVGEAGCRFFLSRPQF